jgi:hypothetical protein
MHVLDRERRAGVRGSQYPDIPARSRRQVVDLFKIQHELIADRSAEAWYRIMIAGPTFHYRWSYGGRHEDGFSNIMGEHPNHAVCREEPSLTMLWGMDVYDREDREDLHFDWAKDYVNSTVRPFWVDFFWNNALIDRVELCRVDGAHGTIPDPGSSLEVSDFEVAVAYLVHDLEDGQECDNPGRYLKGIGVKNVRDRERLGAGSSD